MAPPLPMTMPFWDSCSTKMVARECTGTPDASRSVSSSTRTAHRVRHLLVGEVEDLLADHLGHPERLRLIAGGVGRGSTRGCSGSAATIRIEEPVAVGAVARRRWARSPRSVGGAGQRSISGSKPPWAAPGRSCSARTRRGRRTRAAARARSVGPDALGGVHDQADDIHVLHRALRRLQHELTELAAARVQPRRVHEDDLGVGQVPDPGDAVARGLRPRRDDRQLLADQPVEQRGLARVRPARRATRSPARCSAGLVSGLAEAGPLLTVEQRRSTGAAARRPGSRARARASGPASTRIVIVVAHEMEDTMGDQQIELERPPARRPGAPGAGRSPAEITIWPRSWLGRRAPRVERPARRCAGRMPR